MVWQVGRANRSVGATLMNQESSRSHSIFTVTVEVAENAEAAALKKRPAAAGGAPGEPCNNDRSVT